MSTDVWLTATPQPTRRHAFDSIKPSSDPGPSSYLPSYSYDAALHHAKAQSPPDSSRHLPPSTVPETDAPAGAAHPNVDGNYGDPSDKLFSVYLAQADKFDKEQSESWKGDTEGILVFVCRRTILFLVSLTCFKYVRLVSSLLRWRRSSSRAINSCSRTQATQSFFSFRRSHNNSLLSPVALPSPSHLACRARIFNHRPRPSA
jgi:hypothetical protein